MKWLQLFLLVLFTHSMEAQWIMHTTKTSSSQTTVPTTVRRTTVPTTTTTATNTTVKYTTVHQATKTTTRPSTTRKATMKEVTTTPPTTVPRTPTQKTFTTTPMITHDWFTSTTRPTTVPRITTPKTSTTTTTPMITHDWFHSPTTVPHTTTPKTTTPRITHDWFTPKATITAKTFTTTVPWYDGDSLICQQLPENYNSDHANDKDHVFSIRANSTCVRAGQVLEAKLTMARDDEERYLYVLQVHKVNEAMAYGKFVHPTDTTVVSCGQPHSNNTYFGPVHSDSTDSPIWKAPNNLMEDIIFNATVVDIWSGKYWINVTSQVIVYDPFCNIDVIPPVASAHALESSSIMCFLLVGCVIALSLVFTVAQ